MASLFTPSPMRETLGVSASFAIPGEEFASSSDAAAEGARRGRARETRRADATRGCPSPTERRRGARRGAAWTARRLMARVEVF